MDKKVIINGVEVIAHSDGTITKYHKRTGKPIRAKGCLTGKYYKVGRGYRSVKVNGILRPIHRIIAKAFLYNWNPSLVVDHINGNTQDNRPKNLRMVTSGMNQRLKRVKSFKATSRYRGVWFNKSKNRWESEIRLFCGKRKYLGAFKKEAEAAAAFDKAIIEHNLPREALNNAT
jgi:hypothetical protein